MASKKTPTTPRPRTTVSLKGTVTTTKAGLDFAALLALDYASAWLKRELGLAFPSSGVIRRALIAYAHSLSSVEHPASEARAAQRACSSSIPAGAEQTEAQLRLASPAPGEPLPSFQHVLTGPGRAAELAAVDARVDELVGQVAQTRWGRLKGIHKGSPPTQQETYP